MRCLIRIFGCLISAFGMLVSFGAAVADTCKTSQGEVFERTPIGTFTFTVGWNTDGATGAFYQAAEKWGGISYWTQQPSVSGDNYIIPGGTYVALNSACYTSPSAMSWVDDYDCEATFNGSSLTCLYDGSYLYSPGTGVWTQLGCRFVASYSDYVDLISSGSGTIANCYYTSADNYSDGPSPFIAPAFEWHFSGCDAGYYVDSSISNDTSFVTIPVAGSTSFESSCVDGSSDTDRSLQGHYYTFLGLSNDVADSGYPISLYSGCAICPDMDDISNISFAKYFATSDVPSSDGACYKKVEWAKDEIGNTFVIEGSCWYPE